MACTWFGEICSCCCLTVLLGPAWALLSKIYKPFAGSLYSVTFQVVSNLPLTSKQKFCFSIGPMY